MRRCWQIFRTLALQALLILLLAEIGLRLLTPHHEKLRQLLYMPPRGANDLDRYTTLEQLLAPTLLGWDPYGEHYGFVLSSRGFRTHEYTTPKLPGTFRVAAVGDSFTFACGGLPYSLGWPSLLEEGLRQRTRQKIDVFALGVPGVGPLFERRLWQLEGERVQADVLVLAFFVGNDFIDEMHVPFGDSPAAAIARRSYLARWVRHFRRLQRGLEQPSREPPPLPAPAHEPAPGGTRRGGFERPEFREVWQSQMRRFTPQAVLKTEAERSQICDRRHQRELAATFAKIERLLEAFHAEVTATGTRMTILLIPDRFQVHPEERPAILAYLGRDERDFDWDLPQRRLRALFERKGILSLDLLEAFRQAAAKGEVLYEPGDTHWSPAGNALAARELTEHFWREIVPLFAAKPKP